MTWHKFTLTDKQNPADHMEYLQSYVLTAIDSGLLKIADSGVYFDFLMSSDSIRGDEKTFYLNHVTFEALKEQLTEYKIEPCDKPDTNQLNRVV